MFLRRAGVVLATVWLAAGLGAIGVPLLHRAAVLCGYVGISWLAPALLIRSATRVYAQQHRVAAAGQLGWCAATVAAVLLLYTAAAGIGA